LEGRRGGEGGGGGKREDGGRLGHDGMAVMNS